jgi:hypothetical protein
VSPRYLVSCPGCGQQLAVAPSQAGQSVACACGAAVEAPTLRRLRELPAAPEPSPEARRWGARQGIVAAGAVAATLALGLAGLLIATAPRPAAPFESADFREQIAPRIDEISPAQAWSMWYESYQPLGAAGFLPRRSEAQLAVEAAAQQRKFYAVALASLAGVAIGVALLASLLVKND